MTRQLSMLALALACLTLLSDDDNTTPRHATTLAHTVSATATPVVHTDAELREIKTQIRYALQNPAICDDKPLEHARSWAELQAKLRAAEDQAYMQHWAAIEQQHAQKEADNRDGVVRMPPPAAVVADTTAPPELTADELKQCEQRAIWVHLLIKEMQQQGTYPLSAAVPSPQELVPQVVAERRRLYWPWMRAQEKAKVDLKKLIEAQERAAEAAQELQ